MTVTRCHDGELQLNRRAFLTLGAGSFVSVLASWRRTTLQRPDSLPGTGPAGRLWDPARAGRPLEPVTIADNDAVIRAIEKQLHCTCGCNLDVYTCRTTDFTCTVSPAMHEQVVDLAAQGMTGPQIIDQFVREHGVAILMAPPKRGFNLVTLVLRRWARTAAPDPVPARPLAAAGTPEELERLRGELDRLSV